MTKLYDLSQPTGIQTPPWPTYEPLQVKYFKRLVPNGANGQIITTSNHVGTHLDGPIHFYGPGKDIASIPLDELYGAGVIVDLSDMAVDYGLYGSKDILERVEVKKRDILIIRTGYSRYAWDQPEADEVRYMCKHPGPTMEFALWARKMRLKWIGVDCGSADHPFNTKIRDWMPNLAKDCDAALKANYGKSLEEVFGPEDYQLMHLKMFPYGIIHVENIGGEIGDRALWNRRITLGCFPWRFVGGESAFCRVVAFADKRKQAESC
jgi:kynurenine formamidase